MSITEFLLARIAEKERAATSIMSCDQAHPLDSAGFPPGVSVSCAVAHYRVDKSVKAECQAMRKIVMMIVAWEQARPPAKAGEFPELTRVIHHPLHPLHALAAIWADHEDYESSWTSTV